jgi:hypothetical protein
MRKEESDGDKVGVEGILVGIDVLMGVRDGTGDGTSVADGLGAGILVRVRFSSSGVDELTCPEKLHLVVIITEPMRTKRDNLNIHHLQKR